MVVSFPASETFDQVGRIAAAAIAFRLDFKVKTVNRIRTAIELITEAFGTNGTNELVVDWSKGPLRITISNPKAKLGRHQITELKEAISQVATGVTAKPNSVTFAIRR